MKRFNLLVTGLLIVLLFINAVTVDAQSLYKYKAVEEIRIPEVIYSANPGYVELYNKAWQLALEHVKYQDGLPQSPYVDEAFDENTVWIWDTAFMILFYKYVAGDFSAIETFNNFYVPIHDNVEIPLRIEIPDNPPLFAWTEYEYFKFSNDTAHLRTLLYDNQYLQKHFDWFDRVQPGTVIARSAPTCLKKVDKGYLWEGGRSGMDNTPRGRKGKHAKRARPNNPDMLWIDAIAQQGLSALYIARLFDVLGDVQQRKEWMNRYDEIKSIVNRYYWDKEDQFYYDVHQHSLQFMKVKTPASYWPMLAEMPKDKQANAMVEHVEDDRWFGGAVPWTTVSRDDSDFNPHGGYWRGSMWLPTGYMGIKALQKYNYLDLAHKNATQMVDHMLATYREYTPHTIWECYSPTEAKPAINEHGKVARPDFCGWSALGPISLMIEHVIGLYEVDAANKLVKWHLLPQDGTMGVKDFRFGNVVTDILYKENTVLVDSNQGFTLMINGKKHLIKEGHNVIAL